MCSPLLDPNADVPRQVLGIPVFLAVLVIHGRKQMDVLKARRAEIKKSRARSSGFLMGATERQAKRLAQNAEDRVMRLTEARVKTVKTLTAAFQPSCWWWCVGDRRVPANQPVSI